MTDLERYARDRSEGVANFRAICVRSWASVGVGLVRLSRTLVTSCAEP